MTPRLPYPPIQGDCLRAFHQIRLLARSHDVHLLTMAPKGNQEGGKVMGALCRQVHLVPTTVLRTACRLLQAPFTPLPVQALYYADRRLRLRLRSLLKHHKYDIAHIQLVRMAPLLDELDGMPRVIDFVDALSLNMHRRAQRERGPRAWFFTLESARVRQYEQALLARGEMGVVTSVVDKHALGDPPRVSVVPNGVDTDAWPFAEENRDPYTIVFTGRMGYFANADAAKWFALDVLPQVRQRCPQAQFVVVGSDPPPQLRDLADHPGVAVTGRVPRIQSYLQRATIAVAPMQSGSGIQNKVLEAMSSGAATVATPYALGGIDAVDGTHVLAASTAEEMAEKVVLLLADPCLRAAIARNARQLVEEKYSWQRSVDLLQSVYDRVLAMHR